MIKTNVEATYLIEIWIRKYFHCKKLEGFPCEKFWTRTPFHNIFQVSQVFHWLFVQFT